MHSPFSFVPWESLHITIWTKFPLAVTLETNPYKYPPYRYVHTFEGAQISLNQT